MTPEEFKIKMEQLKERSTKDPVITHNDADDLMCKVLIQLGYGAGVSHFYDMEKWYE